MRASRTVIKLSKSFFPKELNNLLNLDSLYQAMELNDGALLFTCDGFVGYDLGKMLWDGTVIATFGSAVGSAVKRQHLRKWRLYHPAL